MSDREGALAAVVPVAAHIPGGGLTSISFPVAVRILLETVEALVEVRSRVFGPGDSVVGLDVLGLPMPSGWGNGTGVGTPLFGEAMAADGGVNASAYFVGDSPRSSLCAVQRVSQGG
jgi:hypothetical protein